MELNVDTILAALTVEQRGQLIEKLGLQVVVTFRADKTTGDRAFQIKQGELIVELQIPYESDLIWEDVECLLTGEPCVVRLDGPGNTIEAGGGRVRFSALGVDEELSYSLSLPYDVCRTAFQALFDELSAAKSVTDVHDIVLRSAKYNEQDRTLQLSNQRSFGWSEGDTFENIDLELLFGDKDFIRPSTEPTCFLERVGSELMIRDYAELTPDKQHLIGGEGRRINVEQLMGLLYH